MPSQNAHGILGKMEFVKNLLIPHHQNKYRPHLIRRHGLFTALLLIIAVQIVSSLQINAHTRVLGYATNVSISGLLSRTNAERSAAGKSALKINTKLNAAAQAKANDMIANDYWAHTSPTGVTPWYWFDWAGYEYLVAGENLAYGFETSDGVIAGWMNSPSHRDNLLNSVFEDVGFGIANGENYQGGHNTVVVAEYGDPATIAEAPPPPSASSQTPSSAPPTTTSTPAPQPTPTPVTQSEQPKTEAETSTPTEQQAADAQKLEVQTTIVPQNAKRISNMEALLSGKAGWALYTTAAITLLIGFVYAYRHVLFIHRVIIGGEHYMLSHPMLEAGIIYALIWILLSGTFGSVL